MIYNQLQQAYKVSCNSVYGFCGVTGNRDPEYRRFPKCCLVKFDKDKKYQCYTGYLANCWIAQTLTKQGRMLIDETSRLVVEKWPESQIIYGDTDSCYVNPGLSPDARGLKQGFVLGGKMARYITAHFPKPIELEFEKFMRPFLQIAKKRYLYFEWEPGSKPKLGAKGVESQRRDNSFWLRNVYNEVSNIILPILDIDGDQSARIDKSNIIDLVNKSVHLHLENLRTNSIYPEEYVILKQLSGSGYKTPQIHSILREKIKSRVSDGLMTCDVPMPGDRMNFVVVQGIKSSKFTQRGEEPLYQMIHGPPIDRVYYLEKLRDALCRMADCTMDLKPLFDLTTRALPSF